MGRGLGTVQLDILGEIGQLPIEALPRGIPVVVLAERLRCSERQIRRAVHAMAERGLVALVKEPRPGRQGLSLIVWDANIHGAWQRFLDPARRDSHYTQQYERERREWLAQRGLL